MRIVPSLPATRPPQAAPTSRPRRPPRPPRPAADARRRARQGPGLACARDRHQPACHRRHRGASRRALRRRPRRRARPGAGHRRRALSSADACTTSRRACKADADARLRVAQLRSPASTAASRFESVYHLYSWNTNTYLELHVDVPRAKPSRSTRSSDVWPAADWHEREAWDMIGIRFDGPPRPAPHPAQGRLGRPPAAQGLRRPRSRTTRMSDQFATAGARRGHGARPAPHRRVRRRRRGQRRWTAWPSTRSSSTWARSIPRTHGVLRLVVTLDGELVKDVIPVIGYLHRCKEKLAEKRTYFQYIPIVDRTEYVAGMNCEWGYVLTVEKLAGIAAHAARRVHPRHHGRAQPHRQPPGRRRHLHRRPRAARHGHGLLHVPRPREDPRPHRSAHRRAHDVQLLPLRRRALRPARRLGRAVPRAHAPGARPGATSTRRSSTTTPSSCSAAGQGRHHPARTSSTTASPAPTRAPRASPSTCAARGRTRSTPSSTSRSRRASTATCFDRYRCASTRCASRRRSSSSASTCCPAGRCSSARCAPPYVITPPPGACYIGQENPRGEYGTYIVSDGSRYPYRLKYRDPCFVQPAALPQAPARQQDRRRGGHLGQHRPRARRDRPLMSWTIARLRHRLGVVARRGRHRLRGRLRRGARQHPLRAPHAGFLQDRLGPNRTGPQGILQSVADAFKMMGKEDFAPTAADKVMFTLAPIMVMIGAVAIQVVAALHEGLDRPEPERRPHLHRRHHELHGARRSCWAAGPRTTSTRWSARCVPPPR